MQYNTVQDYTIQYNTIQYNTMQYNTIQDYTINYQKQVVYLTSNGIKLVKQSSKQDCHQIEKNKTKQNKTSSEQTKAKISKCTQINDFLGHFYVFRRKKKDNLVKLK